MDLFTLMILILTTCTLLVIVGYRPHKNFPPGPTVYPLIGSFLAIVRSPGKTHQDKIWNLSRKYGPVMGIYLAASPAVVISGYEAAKHVLSREDFAFRPNIIPPAMKPFGKRIGLIFMDGPNWREQRRFTLRNLRDFGFGRRSMEAFIHDEARALLTIVDNAISEPNNKHFDLLPLLPILAINVLWTIMAGKSHAFDDEKFMKLTENTINYFRLGNQFSPITFYRVLENIPFINSNYKKQIAYIKEVKNFIQTTIDEHVATYDEDYMRDFIDVYIKETKANPNSSFTDEQLCALCLDLFTAGTETTSGTLAYGLRYLIQFPQVQTKVRDELYRVIGTERLPGLDDVPKLHYTQAFCTEVFRHSGLAPLTPPHAVHSNTTLKGYDIPKGTYVIINLWSIHMDPQVWNDPENFRPERFLTEEGIYRKDDNAIIFGQGPRMCPGEPLARFSTLLFLTALIQHFRFEPCGIVPSSEQLPGFTTAPAHFKMDIFRAM